MPGYASYGAGVGNFGLNMAQAPDTTQREVLGSIIQASDPVWGGLEFIYARASATIRQYGFVVLTATWDATLGGFRLDAAEAPTTANIGRPLAVSTFAMTSGQYGWFAISGNVPVNCSASLAAGSTFGTGAVVGGQGAGNSAGKQVLNAVISVTASQTIAKNNCQAPSGSTSLQVPNSDGWFPGVYLSGTGIAAGTTVSAISPDGRTITLSASTTAVVSGTVTATYNNGTVFYNVATINRPFVQGAIT